MANDNEVDELEEMRCRTCGTLLGYRRRQGPFLFWCSEGCANSVNAKMERDQVRDEVAVELRLAGVGIMDVSRFIEMPYTRVQQVLYRRGLDLGAMREQDQRKAAAAR